MQPQNPQPPFPEGAKRPSDPQSQQSPPSGPGPSPGWSDPRSNRWAARQQRRQDRWRRRQEAWGGSPGGGMFIGLFVTLLGVAFLLRNLNIIYFDHIGRFWPVVLIAFGISKLTCASAQAKWMGVAAAGFGTLLLLNNLEMLPFNPWQSFWPLVLIAVGVSMLLRHLDGGPRKGPPPGAGWGGGGGSTGPMGPGSPGPGSPGYSPGSANFSSGSFNAGGSPNSGGPSNSGPFNSKNPGVGEPDTRRLFTEVIFTGVQRKITCQEFEGGKISAVFSGVQIDLREANTKLDHLTLHCDAVFGGIDIWIPEIWEVDLRGTGVFGAFHNQTFTRPSRPAVDGSQRPNPRLTVSGGAVFGGVTLKN